MGHGVIAIALGTMLVVTPGLAAENSTQHAASKKGAASDKTKFCIKYNDVAGSRITKADCLTRKEWAAQGVDIDAELKSSKK